MLSALHLDPLISSSLVLASFGTIAGLHGLNADIADAARSASPVAQHGTILAGQPAAQPAAPGIHPVARGTDGMFYLTAVANGKRIRFLVDTGASVSVLTPADAQLIGAAAPGTAAGARITTASGTTTASDARIAKISIGGHTLLGVRVIVLETGVGSSLIGQDLLRRLGPITFDGDRMTIALQTGTGSSESPVLARNGTP